MNLLTKEFADIVGDRAFIFSVIIQFILISLLVFIYSLYSNISEAPVKVKIAVDSNDTELIKSLEKTGAEVILLQKPQASNETEQRGESSETQNETSAATTNETKKPSLIPPTEVVASIDTSSKYVRTDPSNLMSGFAIAKIKAASKTLSFEEALRKSNFTFSVERNINENADFVQMGYGVLVPIAIILPALVAMSLSTQNIFIERKRQTIELLLVSPVSNLYLTFAKVFPLVFASTVCAIAWLFIVQQEIPLMNLPLLYFLAFLFSLLAVGMSVVISAGSKTVKEADALSSILGMLIMITMVMPHNPLSVFTPTIVIARAASNTVDFEIMAGTFLLFVFAIISFFLAWWSVSKLRKSYT
ncbi:MAG: ABC transporter permease [Candidatus Micrarchaeia archaeon]